MPGQCLSEPSYSAAEVQGAMTRPVEVQVGNVQHHFCNLMRAGCKELLKIPVVAFLVFPSEDRPERIFLAEDIPISLQFFELHSSPAFSQQQPFSIRVSSIGFLRGA